MNAAESASRPPSRPELSFGFAGLISFSVCLWIPLLLFQYLLIELLVVLATAGALDAAEALGPATFARAYYVSWAILGIGLIFGGYRLVVSNREHPFHWRLAWVGLQLFGVGLATAGAILVKSAGRNDLTALAGFVMGAADLFVILLVGFMLDGSWRLHRLLIRTLRRSSFSAGAITASGSLLGLLGLPFFALAGLFVWTSVDDQLTQRNGYIEHQRKMYVEVAEGLKSGLLAALELAAQSNTDRIEHSWAPGRVQAGRPAKKSARAPGTSCVRPSPPNLQSCMEALSGPFPGLGELDQAKQRLARTMPQAEAEDRAHDVLLHVCMKKCDLVGEPDQLFQYFNKAIKNARADYWRSRPLRFMEFDPEFHSPSCPVDLDDQLWTQTQVELLSGAYAKLDGPTQSDFDICKHGPTKAANAMAVPVSTAQYRCNRVFELVHDLIRAACPDAVP